VLAKGDLADFDYTRMEAVRRTNVDGLVHVTRAVVDGMKLRGYGPIVQPDLGCCARRRALRHHLNAPRPRLPSLRNPAY